MNSVLRIGLLAAAGYLAYQHFGSPVASEPAAAGGSPEPPPAAPSIDLRSLLIAEIAKQGHPPGALLAYDQWNYFYREIRGAYGPAWEDVRPNPERGFTMSVDEWLSAVSPHGLRGLACSGCSLRGLACGAGCSSCAGCSPRGIAAPGFVRGFGG